MLPTRAWVAMAATLHTIPINPEFTVVNSLFELVARLTDDTP